MQHHRKSTPPSRAACNLPEASPNSTQTCEKASTNSLCTLAMSPDQICESHEQELTWSQKVFSVSYMTKPCKYFFLGGVTEFSISHSITRSWRPPYHQRAVRHSPNQRCLLPAWFFDENQDVQAAQYVKSVVGWMPILASPSNTFAACITPYHRAVSYWRFYME